MNHCLDCNSTYATPGTCNCFAVGGKRHVAPAPSIDWVPAPAVPYIPPQPWWPNPSGPFWRVTFTTTTDDGEVWVS